MVKLQVRIIVGQAIDDDLAAGPVQQVGTLGSPDRTVTMAVPMVVHPLLFNQEKGRVFTDRSPSNMTQIPDFLLGCPVDSIGRRCGEFRQARDVIDIESQVSPLAIAGIRIEYNVTGASDLSLAT